MRFIALLVVSLWFTVHECRSVQQPGTLDESFNADIGGYVVNIVLQPDSKILVGGYFTNVNGAPVQHITRLNVDGRIDPSFSVIANDAVRRIAVQRDGRIVIFGSFTEVNGVARERTARLFKNGVLDPSYEGQPAIALSQLILQPESKLLFGGRLALVRANRRGIWEDDFTVTTSQWGDVSAVALQADGKILVGGTFFSLNDVPVRTVGRLLPNGTVDTTFNTINEDLGRMNRALIPLPDGSVLIGGDVVGKLSPQGRLLEEFKTIRFFTDSVQCMVHAFGRTVIAGNFSYHGLPFTNIARFSSTGELDVGFHSGCPDFTVNTMTMQNDGRILVGGGFTSFSGQTRRGIVRIFGDRQPVLNVSEFDRKTTVVSWEVTGERWKLEASKDPKRGKWSTVLSEPIVINGTNYVTNAVRRVGKHYRLVVQ